MRELIDTEIAAVDGGVLSTDGAVATNIGIIAIGVGVIAGGLTAPVWFPVAMMAVSVATVVSQL